MLVQKLQNAVTDVLPVQESFGQLLEQKITVTSNKKAVLSQR